MSPLKIGTILRRFNISAPYLYIGPFSEKVKNGHFGPNFYGVWAQRRDSNASPPPPTNSWCKAREADPPDYFVSIIFGWAHILNNVWAVPRVTKSTGRAAYLDIFALRGFSIIIQRAVIILGRLFKAKRVCKSSYATSAFVTLLPCMISVSSVSRNFGFFDFRPKDCTSNYFLYLCSREYIFFGFDIGVLDPVFLSL